ncbi:MAG: cobyrinate a,c-diamide synthase [Candidatus Gastranaerophilales bacterium]|nr:cobyrinate a,c-diamide synthase [Candidatus Gastranaerophilales bacterium]
MGIKSDNQGKPDRLLFAAPKSGSGKTLAVCGLIMALKRRGLKVSAVKCGPDYIDPMFHRSVLGVPSGNIDTFFTEEETTRYLLQKRMEQADFTVMEGVMGYYDGLGGQSDAASTYEIAKVTGTPVVLVVDGKGASVSLAALVKGIVEYRTDSNIRGILLNRVTKSFYPRLKELIERECGIPVVGFLSERKELEVPSRHLGLFAPEEWAHFDAWAERVAEETKENVDLDKLLAIGATAQETNESGPVIPVLPRKVRIGVARDEAFSFYYAENLELLDRMGAEIVEFSPLHDEVLPPQLDGLLLGGGYPEQYAGELEQSGKVREALRGLCEGGIPCLAECGGFLYLQQTLETAGQAVDGRQTVTEHQAGTEDHTYRMAGVLPGKGFPTGGLCRFGYIQVETLSPGLLGDAAQHLKGHEFHHWDSTENGADCVAEKPVGGKSYPCMVHTAHMAAGFPHFYYYSNPQAVFHYLQDCLRYQAKRKARERWDGIAKPIDGLGLLEDYVVKLCGIAADPAPPNLKKRALLVLCGDHGVVAEGVTQCGSEVTQIVAANLAKGRSTVNIMAKCARADVYVIDAGMAGEESPEKQLTPGRVADRKLGKGCGNIAKEAAMTIDQCKEALQIGQELVGELKEKGYTIIATGEMGIGNTTPTSALAALFLGEEPEAVTGRGAGLDEKGLAKKREAVRLACERAAQKGLQEPLELLAEAGGYEIAMMAGVFLGGVRHGIPIVADGVISAVAALAASKLDRRVPDFLLASHVSEEPAGRLVLKTLGAEAILHGRMHLGEGTGAVALFPLLDMAVRVYERMGSFADYEIEAYERMSGGIE